ncbi:Na/Pi cotransporter family protein [Flexistipes sp.]|uniref:Na/Pi cotransporter family protein n=1 Tax=Flexistipes sp. TaxID=3088135 RepID=UPI002E1C06FF|nr:Na/Pi cotransporter family protein [Flexistipes sp.]
MDSVNWVALVYGLVGGLGLFLFGMRMMSEGLQKSAGNSLRKILEKLTTNRFIGTFVGLGITAIIQSSSATTVMVVGFVNAGLMNITQSLSIVLGANIGTTVTAQLIAFKIAKLALPAIGIGVFLRLFTKKKKYNYYGEVLIGFGLLFLGLATMKDGFAPLRSSEEFRNAFILFSSTPILAAAAGAILTMIVQSSSATIGITIALASTGLIDFYGASALVLGENIGTTLTANIAAIGTNSAARRAALGHMIFNVVGVAYMLILLKPFVGFIDSITPGNANMINAAGQNPYIARHIANLHTMFNIINTIVFLPILGTLASICKWLIKEDEDEQEQRLKFIDDRLIDTPELAVTQAQKEVQRMSDIALDMLRMSKEAFFQRDHKLIDKIYRKEDVVDLLEKDITDFLVKLFQKSVSEKNSEVINNIFHVLHDIEKIADHAENIAKFTESIIDNKISFSEEALDEMNEIFDVTIRFSSNVLDEYNKGNLPKDIDTQDEDLIDKYKRKFKNNHMRRFNEGKCNVDAGIVYVDILNNLEKAGDHSFNIAQVIQGSE